MSQDYRNAVNGLRGFISAGMIKEGTDAITSYLPKYEEYFSDDEYDNVINDENMNGVRELNAIVEEIRGFTDPDKFPIKRFNQLMKKFDSIMYRDTPHY